ncbi:YeiH family protein [Humibacter albus]|uniref:YeiH family protein n=1 Tax=Humibacter albus TaxID=427754 RepID=UPI0003B708AD|nr:putative sulfate exporter family transporter [Humibacter albus]
MSRTAPITVISSDAAGAPRHSPLSESAAETPAGPRADSRAGAAPVPAPVSGAARGVAARAWLHSAPRSLWHGTLRAAPGLALCAVAVAIALVVASIVPVLSATLVAIVLGVLVRNTMPVPSVLEAGLSFAAKKLLRLGIILLGLQLVVGDVIGLGWGVILLAVAVVGVGFSGTLLVGKWLGVPYTQRVLIAGGSSICGAAAVAAVDGVIQTDKDEGVVTAVALVTVFGSVMLFVVPFGSALLGLTNHQAGLWAGASTHEVAQVVALGGILGGGALAVAVIVKLARVLLLAPMMAVIGVVHRRRAGVDASGKRPPIVPLFVLLFVVMVALRSLGVVPAGVLEVAKPVQGALLAAAMFALGAGVDIRKLIKVGGRPLLLAFAATVIVAVVGVVGVLLLG